MPPCSPARSATRWVCGSRSTSRARPCTRATASARTRPVTGDDERLAAAATHHVLLAHGFALQALRSTLPAGAGGDCPGPAAVSRSRRRRAKPSSPSLTPIRTASIWTRFCVVPTQPRRAGMLPPLSLMHDRRPAVDRGANRLPRRQLLPAPPCPGPATGLDLRAGEFPLPEAPGYVEFHPAERERTSMGWIVEPEGPTTLLVALHAEAGHLPLYITENGCAAEDYANPEGESTTSSGSLFRGHLDAALRAIVTASASPATSTGRCWTTSSGRGATSSASASTTSSSRRGGRLPKRSASFYAAVIRSRQLLDPDHQPGGLDLGPQPEPTEPGSTERIRGPDVVAPVRDEPRRYATG